MRKLIFGVLVIVLSSAGLFFIDRSDGFLHMYLLNVGQGDAILVRTPGGINLLIDGGPDGTVMGELAQALPFFDMTLDYVLLTHPDSDHLEGLISVLQQYTVERVLFTGVYKDDFLSKKFFSLIRDKKIPLTIVEDDRDLVLPDGAALDILFPFREMIGPKEKTNNLSLIAKLIYGENELLLTGDAEAPEEEELLKNHVELDADVLKVGHHGSKTSTTEAFFKKVAPRYALISAGKNNRYGHPHAEVIDRLKKAGVIIYRTDTMGRIELILDTKGIVEIATEY